MLVIRSNFIDKKEKLFLFIKIQGPMVHIIYFLKSTIKTVLEVNQEVCHNLNLKIDDIINHKLSLKWKNLSNIQ
tara:strand:- start:961 stop:1182 length:222 start_codon:yes stop_codon:yes gene_type:complete